MVVVEVVDTPEEAIAADNRTMYGLTSSILVELPVMGTFEVRDGKIDAWRDYFDMNQFTSRMG